jgi:hypothetical protein
MKRHSEALHTQASGMTLSGTNQNSPMNTASIEFHDDYRNTLNPDCRVNASQTIDNTEVFYLLGFYGT